MTRIQLVAFAIIVSCAASAMAGDEAAPTPTPINKFLTQFGRVKEEPT